MGNNATSLKFFLTNVFVTIGYIQQTRFTIQVNAGCTMVINCQQFEDYSRPFVLISHGYGRLTILGFIKLQDLPNCLIDNNLIRLIFRQKVDLTEALMAIWISKRKP